MTVLMVALALSPGVPAGAAEDSFGQLRSAQDEPVRAGYERLYRGDSEGAYQHFKQLAGREPDNLAAAYGVLQAMDAMGLEEAARQKEFESHSAALLGRAQARYDKNKQDKEALFYLAQAYGTLAKYKFEHDKGMWGAARDAAKAKNYSEDYVRLDPGRGDAYFTLGMYNYYVDIAPSFVKFLRVFLFLPGGNRAEGLKQIERAAREGELTGPVATMMLAQIYGFLEGRPEEGLRLAEELNRKYPDNPEFNFLLARLEASPAVEDFDAAAKSYRGILARAEQGHPHYKGGARYAALSGLARAQQLEWRIEDAVATLTPTIDSGVDKPDWVLPSFLLSRANLRLLLNDPTAEEDTRRVLAQPKWKPWHKTAKQQLEQIRGLRSSGDAAIYAALIPGNRLVAEGKWEAAEEFYQGMQAKHPGDAQVRYRLAYLEFARGHLGPALTRFNDIANANPGKNPAWLKANALLYLARVHDLQGRREQAVKLYKRIVDDFEGESAAGAARVGLISPYRRAARAST